MEEEGKKHSLVRGLLPSLIAAAVSRLREKIQKKKKLV